MAMNDTEIFHIVVKFSSHEWGSPIKFGMIDALRLAFRQNCNAIQNALPFDDSYTRQYTMDFEFMMMVVR